jgi:aspartate carbamoyltransferase catalytic subunit
MKHIISIKQFLDKSLLDDLFARAKDFSQMPLAEYPQPLQHLTVATIFYEPSTRTRLSFETAIQNLGAHLISTENAGQFSSAIKGETLQDSILTISTYADAIVLRHPEIGAAERAASVSRVPIINAGDGAGEHPTQALLDLYTIKQCMGKIDGLKIALVGDLLNGRTIHSLMQLLAIYNVELQLVAPESLRLPKNYEELLTKAGVKFTVHGSWDGMIGSVDVLYMTRVQKERFKLIEDYMAVKDSFILTLPIVQKMKPGAIIMHPLPRVNEIDVAVDADPRAKYFEQVKNGLYVRMALLDHIFST